ncbi:hypothetical protein [Paenibacillus sp. NPDC057934]|uniref:hypothetical protein n=1 Tax=Paenibacillus sp. NPDC057934 TaxID=3346282 RepID=UPI0036DB4950
MDTKERLIDLILRCYGQSNDRIDEQLIIQFKEEEREQIKYIGVPMQKRNDFYWRLYALTERVFFEQSDITDEEQLALIVAQEWNKHEREPQLTSEVCRLFIQRSNLKISSKRKALESLSRGDIESSKAFQSQSKFFSELLCRYVICHAKLSNELELCELVDEITAWFFPEGQRETARSAMRSIGFLTSKKPMGRIRAYQKFVGPERLVFQAGITEILIEHKGHHTISSRLESFIKLLENKDEDTTQDQSIQLSADACVAVSSVIVDKRSDTIVVSPDSLRGEENSLDSLKVLLAQALGVITGLEQLQVQRTEEANDLAKITVEDNHQTSSMTNEQDILRVAEEEIERLKQALEQEKLKTRYAEEKTLVQLITDLGGKGKYLLSDLLEESLGIKPSNPVVSTGRLINLFSILDRAIGLERYSDGRELNEPFSIFRNELTKTFEVNAPIQSQEDRITVKIIKYGWMLDNKVVVSPLVSEITTEQERS